LVTENCASGLALIHVDSQGQNSITIVSGANGRVTPLDLMRLESVIQEADAVILQLEIPLETVAAALTLARKHGVPTILDPSPVPPEGLPEALFDVDILTPNQSEAGLLTGVTVHDWESATRAARALLARGARHVVLKMGADGALILSGGSDPVRVEAFEVAVVDTTAAGDAFTAGLALQYALGAALPQAARFACAAGSLATTQLGAQPSMPSLAEVRSILQQHHQLF
jgi:ribokinase